jgi:hypothetical protein
MSSSDEAKFGRAFSLIELLTAIIDISELRFLPTLSNTKQNSYGAVAREAHKLSADTMLGGWLHHDTCFVASKLMRAERRRQLREKQAIEMNDLNQSDNDFDHLGPVLAEVINELLEADRMAILLRFYII